MIVPTIASNLFSIFNSNISQKMIRKLVFLFTFFLFSCYLSAQSEKGKIYLQAQQLFQDEKYGLAQNLFHQIYMDELALESQKTRFYILLFVPKICLMKIQSFGLMNF